MRNTKIFILGMGVMPLALLAIAVAVASSVTTPNTFMAGTPAVAAEVNANFAAHAVAINDNDARISAMQVWAQTDGDPAGVNNAATGQKEINSININVPMAGVLVISGGVFINNAGGAEDFTIQPKLDGTNVLASDDAAFHEAPGAGVGDLFSLNYTASVAVTAGPHTVSQTAGPQTGTTNFFHNRETFTVMFFPNGAVTTPNSP